MGPVVLGAWAEVGWRAAGEGVGQEAGEVVPFGGDLRKGA